MTWCIVGNAENDIIHGPTGWNALNLQKLLSGHNLNVSLPAREPSGAIIWPGIRLAPVTDIAMDTPEGYIQSGTSLSVEEDGTVISTPTFREMTEEEINPPPDYGDMERNLLENAYLEATRGLIHLATGEPADLGTKLEDIEFQMIMLDALNVDTALATALLTTINYTFFQLKLKGHNWEDITWHELPEA